MLGCQRVGKTLAFDGVKAGSRATDIETVILGVAGDNSRSTAGNFDDISVGHVSFLLLASVSTQISGHTSRLLCQSVGGLRLTEPNANAGMTRSAGATVSFKRNLGVWLRYGSGGWDRLRLRASRRSREFRRNPSERQTGLSMRSPRGCGGTSSTLEMGSPVRCH